MSDETACRDRLRCAESGFAVGRQLPSAQPPTAAGVLISCRSVFVEVAKVSDVPVGRVKAIHVDGRILALYHTANGFFATDNTCPHRGGPLAEGDLAGNEITCPWHFWGFDVVTGACPGNPEIAVATHAVRVEGDSVLVRLS